jgi:hypothetical protein
MQKKEEYGAVSNAYYFHWLEELSIKTFIIYRSPCGWS